MRHLILSTLVIALLSMPVQHCSASDQGASDTKQDKQQKITEQDKGKKEKKKVLHFDKKVVEKALIADGNSACMDNSIKAMEKYDAILQPVLDAYLKDKSLSDDFNIEGVTIRMIEKKYGESFWGSLRELNRLAQNREEAKKFNPDIPSGIM
jgi:hypothetical protein